MTSHLLGKDQPVDMGDLISFSMGFSKLGLVLGDVVSRLGQLEKQVNDPTSTSAGRTSTGHAVPVTGEDSRPDRVNRTAPIAGASLPDESAAGPAKSALSSVTDELNPTKATSAAGAPGSTPDAVVAVPASDLAALTKRVKALEDEVDALRNSGGRNASDTGVGEVASAGKNKAPTGDTKDAEARAKAAERTAQDAFDLAKSAAEKADAVSDRLSKQLRRGSTPANGAAAGAEATTNPSASPAAVDDLADQLAQLSKAVDKIANQQRGHAGDIAALSEAAHQPQAPPATAPATPSDVVSRIAALEDAVKKSSPIVGNGVKSSPENNQVDHQGVDAGPTNDTAPLRAAIRAVEDRVAKLESSPSTHPSDAGSSGPGKVGAGAGSAGEKSGAGDKSTSGDRTSGKPAVGDKQIKDLADKVAELQKRLDEQVPHVTGTNVANAVDKSIAAPSGALELERLQSQMKQLAGDVEALKRRPSGDDTVTPVPSATGSLPSDLPARIDAMQLALDDLNTRVAEAFSHNPAALGPNLGGEPSTDVANQAARAAHDARAASEAADQALKRLNEMNEGQAALRKKIQQIEAALAAIPSTTGDGVNGSGSGLTPLSVEDAVKKVLADRDQATLKAGLAPPVVGATATILDKLPSDVQQSLAHQVLDIRATVDHLIHGKADAAQVANKAERDYVEGALEKLMQEVERVINITNASLIDTLDKSLGLLRDMIDGKATKADLAKARLLGAQGTASGMGLDTQQVPDGLIGFKSYRCLGCNRTVEAMRVRPMGSSAQAFSAKLPPSATTRQPKPPALSASLPALTAPLPPIPPSSA